MKIISHLLIITLLLLIIPLLLVQVDYYKTAYADKTVTFESPDKRNAVQILGNKIVKGPHYTIRDKVITYGYMHHYTVDSDYGVFEVTGDHALLKLLKEISAISELKKIKDTDAYLEAVKQAGMAPIDFGVSMINDPVDTVTAVPKGAFSMLKNLKESLTSEGDPGEDSTAKQLLAVSSTKREYAYQLGVDVYSSNKVLQKELNRIGWAGAIGGLSVSVATMPLGGAAITIIKTAKLADDIRASLRSEPPSKLRTINREKLVKIGVSEDIAEKFLSNPYYAPWHDTIITSSLFRLEGVAGISDFIEFALGAEDEVDANFVSVTAQTLGNYHKSIGKIKNIKRIENIVIAETVSGKAIIPFPLDYGVWTKRADQFFNDFLSENPEYKGKLEFWVTGKLSKRAKQELSLRKIKFREDIDKKFVYIY